MGDLQSGGFLSSAAEDSWTLQQTTRDIIQRDCALPEEDTISAVEPGLKITKANATDLLKYEQEYKVLICAHHGYAIRNLRDHLQKYHRGTCHEKKEVVQAFAHYELQKPVDVPLPSPLGPPFISLGRPLKAYICEEEECEKISVSRDAIRKHCYKAHEWKSRKDARVHWHHVYVQTFFTAGLEKYFTVQHNQEDDNDFGSNSPSADDPEVSHILKDWNTAKKEHEKSLEIIDGNVAKTDRTLWFKRNGWPEHLGESNLKHLSRASRLPDRDEAELQQAVQTTDTLIERCLRGLPTLDQETRRWLRSAKPSEADVRPLARLQNPESEARYASYMKRFICYAMRVARSNRNVSTGSASSEDSDEDDDTKDDDSDNSGESDSDSGQRSNRSVDVFEDARRLFPWRENQRELIERLWEQIETGQTEGTQAITLLEFFKSVIFCRVRGDVFSSALMHFLAILGIDEETNRLREANDFSYMLAGIVYCTRIIAIEVILPSAERDAQGDEDDERFLKLRTDFLADGSYSPMSKMISLLAYGKHVALNHANAGSIMWSNDRRTLSYRGRLIYLTQFRQMVLDVITEAEDLLWRQLMWTNDSQRFELALNQMEDDVTWTRRGVSFINNRQNGLEDRREWMLKRARSHVLGRKLLQNGDWVVREVRKYLRLVDRFRELLLFCVHLTSGQPARGTEVTSIRFKNGFYQDRNVFIIHGQAVVVTRYHKSQSQYDKPKVIPRFLPQRVGQLLAIYLVYIHEMLEYLSVQVKGQGWSEYVWANEHGPWDTDRLTKVIARETEKRIGTRLTTHDYRHVAISIGREVVGESFARGYTEEAGVVEEAEVDEDGDDVLEMSAGRTGEIGANRYGVSADVIKHLSSRSVDTFRPLSEKWHAFLGLGGSPGIKRTQEAATIEENQEAEERRIAVMLRNNGIGNWGAAFARMNQGLVQFNPLRPIDGEGNRGWFFGQDPISPPTTEVVTTTTTTTPIVRTPGPAPSSPVVTSADIEKAMQKVLRSQDVAFKSKEQEEAMHTILQNDQQTPLVVVLPTGGGKSLLFMTPACIDDPGITIVVVPYRALINNMVERAQQCGIDCIEWRPGEHNPAALVYVSADFVWGTGFLGYAQLLQSKGLLRRVFVDECHLTFTASDWRPKLAEVRAVRGLRCPLVLLTATLPCVLEFELEASMAAHMARYIRASTTRIRTRYIVEKCKPGSTEETGIAIARRMQKHLRSRKGVIYSRSREQCERVAQELGCAYYHAGAADNEERLQRWLEEGGLIVATSALGTGVDFPGIVFVLHVDLPYGMIDFAQESGRAGRGGEDVDSVIVIDEGRVENMRASGRIRGLDDSIMGEFVTTTTCRRAVMSTYLDGEAITCEEGDRNLARCDRCGEGLTAIERQRKQAALNRQLVEETVNEVADSCVVCWTLGSRYWATHSRSDCPQAGLVQNLGEADCEQLRSVIRYDGRSHSCHKCGFSQKLCVTGRTSTAKCQWPNVMVVILRGLTGLAEGRTIVERLGFEGDIEERGEYGRWLGLQHERRIWGEVMSNAMAVVVQFIVCRNEWFGRVDLNWAANEGSSNGDRGLDVRADVEENRSSEDNGEDDEAVRQRVRKRVAERWEVDGEVKLEKFWATLLRWEAVCVICKAAGREVDGEHRWSDCIEDELAQGVMERSVQLFAGIRGKASGGCPKCWMPYALCGQFRQQGATQEFVRDVDGYCEWPTMVREVALALVYTGPVEVRAWVLQDQWFRQQVEDGTGTEEGGTQALAEFFRQGIQWGRARSNMACEMIRIWG